MFCFFNKKDESFDEESNRDWSQKYDVAILTSRESYNSAIELMRHLDNKASNYFFIINIFFASLCVILSSDISKEILIKNIILNEVILLSCEKILFLIWKVAIIFSMCFFLRAAFNVLKVMKLVKSYRMPNILNPLKEFESSSSLEFKGWMIDCYETTTNDILSNIDKKKSNLEKASNNIVGGIILFAISLLILFLVP